MNAWERFKRGLGWRSGGPAPGTVQQVFSQLLAPTSYSDVRVSTLEDSLQVTAVRAAVDLLASIASELPIRVYRGEGRDRVRVRSIGPLSDPSGEGQGLPDWCYQVMVSWLLRGNVYGDILDRSDSGQLRQVLLFHPDVIRPQIDGGGRVRWFNGGQEIPAERMLHARVNPIPGVLLGMSPIRAHADMLGISLAATKFGLQFFQDGGHPGGILSNSVEEMQDEAVARTAKDRFLAALRGTREPVVLGKGWSWQQVQIAPEESQFLETQKYSQAECARIFGPGVADVLGYETGQSMTYANMVDRDLSLLKYAGDRWLRRMERLLSRFLPSPQYVEFDRDAFLETSALQRFQKHEIALRNRIMTPNEVRDIERLPATDWGNEPLGTGGEAAQGQEEKDEG